MAQRLRFILDGDDHLSPVLNGAGDASARLHRRLNDDMNGNGQAVRRFTQDADGRLRDLRGRFVSVADAQRLMGDGMPDLTRRLGDVSSAGGDAAASLGRSGGGLGGTMIGVAAIAGMALLPAIGALVPMLAGAGLAAGTLKLGFAGVADAMEAAGKGKEEYAESLKKLSPPARDFTKALVDLKKQFGGVGKEIQKAMLPGFTKAVQAAGPVVKILGRAMTELGGAFGDAAEGVGRMLKDSGFQGALQKNLQMGTGFIRDMTSSIGPLIRSVLDFGAASGPTLKAFSDGIGGLLSKGIPGFFDGLKTGIGGAAKFLDGLFDAVNSLLPAFGRLSGEIAKVTGPIFGELFRAFGQSGANAMDMFRGALELLAPVLRDIGYGIKTMNDVAAIIAPTLKDVGLALLSAFAPVGDAVNRTAGPLQRLNQWVNNNKIAIMEAARIFGGAIIDMADVAISATPKIIGMFRLMSTIVLSSLSGIVHGAAAAWGWIPGIGDKLKGASRAFDKFKGGFLAGLATAEQKSQQFATSAGQRLAAGKLKLNINNWTSQIAEAKKKLSTVPPSKQAALKATIADLTNKIASARAQLNDIDGKTANTYVVTHYKREDGASFLGPSGRYASGGLVGFPGGGPVSGPGTATSDSIPAMLSNGEYVINAKSTAKYRGLLDAINQGTLGAGTGMPGAGRAVGQGLVSGMAGATAGVGAAARRMAAAVTAGIREELQIASPSKKTKALAKDVGKGFIAGLTGSRDKIKAVAKDLAADIRTAFSGKKESSLLKRVDKDTKKLLDLAAKRDKIAAKIAEAKAYASDVTKNAREGASLSNLGMEPEQVTAGGIKGGLASKLAQVKHFTQYIEILAKRGLNKGLLRQILNMGPEAGYAYASALVGADKNTFKQINSLQSQLDKSTNNLGRVGADKLYDAGKNAGKGFLKGLEGQQKDIEKLMLNIAKGMQKAIKKALGIKSPSTVMARLGTFSTMGLARGLVAGMPSLDRALDAVSGRVAATQPVLGRPAVAASGGGSMNVQISVTDARDPIATAREIRRELLELKRVFGLNLELKVG